MDYFIQLPNDTNKDLINDEHLIGHDNKFGVFWAGGGWNVLQKIINEIPNLVDKIKIIDEKGNEYSILKFIDKIKDLQIRIQR